jgi:hypothetical protein
VRPRPIRRQMPLHQEPRLGVETAHRLVEHEQRQIGQQQRKQTELLRHALGIVPDRPAERARLELQLLGECGGAGALCPAAVKGERQADELVAGQVTGRLEALRQIGEPGARTRQVVRLAEQTHGAGLRRSQHQDRLEQAGLARPVQPEQAEGLVPVYGQRDGLEDGRAAIAHAQPVDFDRRWGGLDHGSRGRSRGASRTDPTPGRLGRASAEETPIKLWSGSMLVTRYARPRGQPLRASLHDCITRD